MYVNTVPASVRCTPSTRMSRMTKGWMARDARGTRSATARRRRWKMRRRLKASAGEQAIQVVVEGEEGEAQEQREPETLPDFHDTFGDRPAHDDFGEIIHQVPPIQQRNGQQVQHAEAHAHEGEEAE